MTMPVDAFVAEIRLFPFPFAPSGWALCNGQLIAVQQNPALFSLIGTAYGGDGRTNFGLPNLQARVPMCVSQVLYNPSRPLPPGLTPNQQGQMGGEVTHTLLGQESVVHSHLLSADAGFGSQPNPGNMIYTQGVFTGNPGGAIDEYTAVAPDVALNPNAIAPVGSGQAHNNLMPYLTLSFCIALQGIFPQRP